MTIAFPPKPQNVPADFTQINAAYKRGVRRAVTSIAVFFLLYLLLLALPVAGFFYFIQLKLIPLALFCFVVFVIQVYFLFARKKREKKPEIVLKREAQPEFFSFIDQLCEEIGAKPPKKIVLSSQNNAGVFQETGLWGLIVLPRKNLEIGLLLLASVDVTEFKAILAHEFGHFAQSSTRIGSYLYTANSVIGNIVFSNEFWGGAISEIARVHIFFYVFLWLVFQYGMLQRRLFALLYRYINKSFFSLSREMEFHADSVAVSVTGSMPIINSLKRIDFAEYCAGAFDQFVAQCAEEENRLPVNYFELYHEYARMYAGQNRFSMTKSGLINLQQTDMKSYFPQCKLKYADLWQSHPPLEEREKNAFRVHIPHVEDETPAVSLFRDLGGISRQMSELIYTRWMKRRQGKPAPYLAPTQDFLQKLRQSAFKEHVPERFASLYDNRIITWLDYFQLLGKTYESPESFEELVGTNGKQMFQLMTGMQRDMQVLDLIRSKRIDVSTFEYDGRKYSRREAESVMKMLEKNYEDGKAQFRRMDENVFLYHVAMARRKHMSEEQALYNAVKVHDSLSSSAEEITKIIDIMAPVVEELQRVGTMSLQTFQYHAPKYYTAIDAINAFYQRASRMEMPAQIGGENVEYGLFFYLWQEQLPDYRRFNYTYDLFSAIWKKLHTAFERCTKLRVENHHHILRLYEKIYCAEAPVAEKVQ